MNIAIDIGNSAAKAGIFEGDRLMKTVPYLAHDELVKFIEENKPDHVIFGSVNVDPQAFIDKVAPPVRCWVANHKLKTPIKNAYATPLTLGVDRLAGVVAAHYLYPAQNCLVIDIGTCITYDVIESDGTYKGGSISPGIRIKFKALNTFTARLPFVEAVTDFPTIGADTTTSIQSGVLLGTLAEIEGMIQKLSFNFSDFKTIICGGDSKFFESKIKAPIFVVPELVLIGLNRLLQYNASHI